MTVALHDDVTTVAPTRTLKVVRDTDTVPAAAPKKVPRRIATQLLLGGDPLVDGATRLLSIPLRHAYAALWRVGVLEIQA
ncbi:hypothetical protein HMPREF0591_0423 [Mycobacterium parascrofulaceum ATCC BAA-614]|uniref:Uncharacterized protein n=1 Tax=Mycobacterium parascrofulaceum ATCC BAA-614 TaxID=525368 RepID=D5P2M9_9MYCO|nr:MULTISPECIES: Rv1535 family protein [Mycobacterium]EFG79678.1 hypothetical protein HMPREF0591_0423 [Mycobacterium parascrofulaceum ATCC BAA-614]OCB60010.1 hypothetical protein A9X02_01020 [Mycobacterium malmoense]